MSQGPLLDLRHLQMIRAIARHGRVSDAASALGLTPSALSHRIREAERRLDVALYVRMHKQLRMTAAAELLADVAERVLGDLENAEADVRRMSAGIAHVIRIMTETYSAYHWLPDFRRQLQAQHPGIELQIMAPSNRTPMTALAARKVDLVIASEVPGRMDLVVLPLFEDELLFIMPLGHAHASKPFVRAADIVGEEFITTTRTPAPDREFARLFRPNDSYPKWTATVEMPEAIIDLVAAGQGTSILAGWAMRPAIAAGRITGTRVGEDGLHIPWNAVVRREDATAGPVAAVAATLQTWVQETNGFG